MPRDSTETPGIHPWPSAVSRPICLVHNFKWKLAPLVFQLPPIPLPLNRLYLSFYNPSQISSVEVQGLFSISEPPFVFLPLHTSRKCLTLSNSCGLIIPMAQISHTIYTFGRSPTLPDFSSARFSMVCPRHPPCASVYSCSFCFVCSRDAHQAVLQMYNLTY